MKKLAKSAFAASLLTCVLALPAVAAPFVFPLRVEDGFPSSEPPSVTAASWVVFDELTDTVLASWNADTQRAPASITKILTVLVAVEHGDMDDVVTVSSNAARTGGQEIGLVEGEEIKLGALVRAALVRSGNDAATAIAEHIGGSVEGFSLMMNEKVAELGLENSRFANPHGLDEGQHYSSAADMLAIARAAMEYKEIADIARSRVMVFPDTPNGSQRTATNTNRILNSYEGVIGVKTGETPNAGLTYVGAAERNGRRVYVVVFRSQGRRGHFADAISLFDWAFDSLGVHATLGGGIPYEPIADRVSPSPLLTEGRIGAQAPVAPPTVDAEAPTTPGPDPRPEPPMSREVMRSPSQGSLSLPSSFGHWLRLLLGGRGE